MAVMSSVYSFLLISPAVGNICKDILIKMCVKARKFLTIHFASFVYESVPNVLFIS